MLYRILATTDEADEGFTDTASFSTIDLMGLRVKKSPWHHVAWSTIAFAPGRLGPGVRTAFTSIHKNDW